MRLWRTCGEFVVGVCDGEMSGWLNAKVNVMSVRGIFFCQAEDGIREAQESRGLGDVYKKPVEQLACARMVLACQQGAAHPVRQHPARVVAYTKGRLMGLSFIHTLRCRRLTLSSYRRLP